MCETTRRSSGIYGVNNEGSGDMYYKGGNMLHMIRQLVDNDEKWRGILRRAEQNLLAPNRDGETDRGLHDPRVGNRSGPRLRAVLTTTQIPVLEYKLVGSTLSYRWANVVAGFQHAGAGHDRR